MNIKKKFTSFVLTFAIVLSFGQPLSVQAATSDLNSVTTSANSAPNPGIPENKPNVLNVISQYKTQSGNNIENSKVNITSTIGWKNKNGDWYYYKSDNTRASGWIKPDSNWYYLKDDGKMATGWLSYKGTWYYLDKSGSMIKGWKQLNNIWYFLNDSGAMITGLNQIDNKTYMFYNSGAMANGWMQLSNHWYYFNSNGSMTTGWIVDNGVSYYLYDTGAMAKGWINLSGTWYYLKESGAMSTGLVNSGSDSYYLDPSTGKLLTNTTIDGYKIGSDGKKLASVDSNGNSSNSSVNSSVANSNSSPTTSSKFKGIDISHYNGDIDFKKVKASGIDLVYIKATEGTTYVDNYLGINYNGAKSAGLKTGFYHFLVGTSSPETQADNFYNNIKDKQSDLKPVLDVETTGFDVMDYTLRFIEEFKKISNMDICIYTYSDFISNLDNRLAKYTLWEANWYKSSSNLPSNNVWSLRAGHQYTDQGTINGINSYVDLDEFTQDIFR
ncbi:GH25 family lysozyme [Clostridium uliginosum]|uniref:Lysozyme n=1 Tax=Clostridium uliginosum TaxID=119641 RepID=A0A1I1JIS0_9CLOT|nr:GH25 family lysozyme [Clostridium uliginosum]SFC48444.1 Lyzozyme M1 (1,4-beta-N-acetylmuramidase), GH25 family [Clostridium uliginosum]